MANAIIQFLVLFGIPFIVCSIIALFILLIVLIFFHFRKPKRVDALKLIYSEIVELAKINRDWRMIRLYRLDMPPVIDYINDVQSAIAALHQKEKNQPKKTKENKTKLVEWKKENDNKIAYWNNLLFNLNEYTNRIGRNKRGVYKGEIIGYNRWNLYTSFTELYQAETNGTGYKLKIDETQEYTITNEEYAAVEKTLDQCGGFINIIVYRVSSGWVIPFIWERKIEKAVLCFDDQLMGRDSDDGILTLLAPGMETHGFYFEIPSGSPDRTKIIISVIKSLTWIRTLTQLQSNLLDVVNQSMNINPALAQLLAVKNAEKSVTVKQTKE